MGVFIQLLSTTLRMATPIIFAAMGGLISEKAGVTNIALEGMMTMGAFFGVLGSHLSGDPWFGVLLGILCGGVAGLIHAFVCIHFRAQQVISGTAINLFATAITSFMIFKIFKKGGQTDLVTSLSFAPGKWFAGAGNFGRLIRELNWFVFAAIICVVLVWWFLSKTTLGLRVRSVGEHPKAADTLGVNVNRIRYGCVIVSGLLAGLGGVSLSLSATPVFIEGMVSGRGFIALAAVVFGKWKPVNVLLACFLFGFADAFQILAQGFGWSLPTEVYSALPYIMSLLAMVLFAGKATAPKACGKPYLRENDK